MVVLNKSSFKYFLVFLDLTQNFQYFFGFFELQNKIVSQLDLYKTFNLDKTGFFEYLFL